jgi:Permuted papain-like amidase enzyme, YaeF/YiiX, C92 family
MHCPRSSLGGSAHTYVNYRHLLLTAQSTRLNQLGLDGIRYSHRKVLMRFFTLVFAIVLYTGTAWCAINPDDFRDGDIIFQTSRSAQSLAIQRATNSPYSHCGIVFIQNGKPYVYEAVSTVSYTPLSDWIARGEGQHFVVKRLKNADTVLTAASIKKMQAVARRFKGRPYDLTFEWSDKRIYCSELVWKIYDQSVRIKVGKIQKLKEFRLSDPIVAKKLKERYGSRVPKDEPVISPEAIFQSDQLVTVVKM